MHATRAAVSLAAMLLCTSPGQGADPTTSPTTQWSASSPSDCWTALGKAIAAGDRTAVQKLYRPAKKDAPTARDLLELEQAVTHLNAAARERWGEPSQLADPPSTAIPKLFSGDRHIVVKGDSADSFNSASGLLPPHRSLVKVDGSWAVDSLGDRTSRQYQLMGAGLKRVVDNIAAGKYQSVDEATSEKDEEMAKVRLARVK